jgi:hypothetical protein
MRGTATRSDGASVSPACFGSSTPIGNAIEVIRIFLRERARHEVDDELLVGANIGAGEAQPTHRQRFVMIECFRLRKGPCITVCTPVF